MAAHPAEARLVALHTLRCVGACTLGRLALAVRWEAADLESELIDLAVEGAVTRTTGPGGAWSVTPAGKELDAALVAAELGSSGAGDRVEELLAGFVELNPLVLEVFTDWQLRRGPGAPVLNDHSDHRYDARVLRRLRMLHGEARRVLADLAALLVRFAVYQHRLDDALARADRGDLSAVSDDLESYHTVWFQLHEDLLTTVGRPRT